MHCPSCKAVVPDGSKFCEHCGSELPRACLTCGHGNSAKAKFCSKCGESLTSEPLSPVRSMASRPVSPLASPSSAERRQLTIMFCDMVGSSALSTKLDPEEQGDVIAAFHTCCASEIKSLGGMVAQFLGDGLLAYFGYPTAHENDAERAILSGLAILKAVGTLKPAGDVALQARIAIGSGVVVVGDLIRQSVTQENAAIGETTNLVARLQSLAEPNSVVISPVTHRLVGALFDYRDLGRHNLKGFSEPVHVRQVLGPSKIESRFEAQHQAGTSPLLGREEELELLLRRWEQAKRGEGRVVLLTGEPGIGKSRLARALQDRLVSQAHTPLNYFCSPNYQDSALYPNIVQVVRAAAIERDDTDETKLDKLQTLLGQSSGNLPQDMPLFAALLSIPGGKRYPLPEMTPQRRKERTLAALLDHIKRIATHQPVLMVFEDLHWIDPTSLELLTLAIDQIKDQRILLVATARQEFTPPWPSHRHISTVSLNRLGRSEGQALIEGITKGKPLPAEVLEQIMERTDGVPLFIEELTKTILESGLLREAKDRYDLTGPLPSFAIPSTLHASLLARLDRLASVKDVAQIGAAIGREFSYSLMAAVAALPEQLLQATLKQLVDAELIFQRGLPPDARYQFKHALVQDAAYASLVKSRRQHLHGAIARALAERFPDIVAAAPEIVAHHLTEAGFTDEAIDYWRKAGERALGGSAYVEAVKHLKRGIEQAQLLPDSTKRPKELALQIILGQTAQYTKGYPAHETLEVYQRARDLLDGGSTLQAQVSVLYGLWACYLIRAEHRAAHEVADQILALGARHDQADVSAMANRLLGTTLSFMGELVDARRHLKRSLQLVDVKQGKRVLPHITIDRANALLQLSRTLWILGYPQQATFASAQCLTHAQEMGQAIHMAMALHTESNLGVLGADPKRAVAVADKAIAHCMKYGLLSWELWARAYQAISLVRSGNPLRGISALRDTIAGFERISSKIDHRMWLSQLAAAHANLGQPEVGLGLLDEAFQTLEETGERHIEAELHRLRGEMLLMTGKPSDAEANYLQALMIARRQQARWWELRAATNLARLWRDQGKCVEARDLLVPVYGWFTEGFDLADLKDAKALLDQLSA